MMWCEDASLWLCKPGSTSYSRLMIVRHRFPHPVFMIPSCCHLDFHAFEWMRIVRYPHILIFLTGTGCAYITRLDLQNAVSHRSKSNRANHGKNLDHGECPWLLLAPSWPSRRWLAKLLRIPPPAESTSDAGISSSRGSSLLPAGLASIGNDVLAENDVDQWRASVYVTYLRLSIYSVVNSTDRHYY